MGIVIHLGFEQIEWVVILARESTRTVEANENDRIIEGSLNRNFRQYGELKSSSRVVKSVDRRCNSVKVKRKKIHPRQMLEKSRNAVFFQ